MTDNPLRKQPDFLFYTGSDGKVNIKVFLKDETIWLTQKAIGEIFGKSKATISEHLKNIYAEGELIADATVRNFRTVQKEGKREVERNRLHYNLDVIISVGYRVNSKQGVQFRIWANKILKEYLVKGYALNERKLKETQQQFIELQQSIKLLENVVNQKQLNSDEATSLLM